MPSQNLLDVPLLHPICGLPELQAMPESIVEHYQDCDLKRTPPLLVYGLDMGLFSRMIIDGNQSGFRQPIDFIETLATTGKRGIPCS
ncbi:hypothetical protein MASR2M48_14560 [Spirochaetota bacterium]